MDALDTMNNMWDVASHFGSEAFEAAGKAGSTAGGVLQGMGILSSGVGVAKTGYDLYKLATCDNAQLGDRAADTVYDAMSCLPFVGTGFAAGELVSGGKTGEYLKASIKDTFFTSDKERHDNAVKALAKNDAEGEKRNPTLPQGPPGGYPPPPALDE